MPDFTPYPDYDSASRYGVVYLLTNSMNGKKYVGQTRCALSHRLSQHWRATRTGMAITSAIRKYGKDNFNVTILQICDNQLDLDEQEIHWSQVLCTMAPNGYNFRVGSGRGTVSEITRRKISEAKKGTKVSEETRAKLKLRPPKVTSPQERLAISLRQTGVKFSEERCRKISEACKRQPVNIDKMLKMWAAREKTFTFLSPSGETVTITNLERFCEANGLRSYAMSLVASGKQRQHQNWTDPRYAWGVKKHGRERAKCRVCGEPAKGHEMCQKHLARMKKYGDPLLTKRRGGSTLIREEG